MDISTAATSSGNGATSATRRSGSWSRQAAAALQSVYGEFGRQQEAQARLAGDELALEEKRAALAGLTSGLKGGDEALLPMPPVAVDNVGLSAFGAVLAFAWSQDTPALLDSAADDAVLYFRGTDGQFFSVYYDTTVSRLVTQIPLASGRLVLTSRETGLDVPELGLTVSDGPDPGRCTVVITRTSSTGAYTETFEAVPRRADQLAAVLNGTQAGELLGTVASVQGATVTLASPRSRTRHRGGPGQPRRLHQPVRRHRQSAGRQAVPAHPLHPGDHRDPRPLLRRRRVTTRPHAEMGDP